jgi:hypothetical protein
MTLLQFLVERRGLRTRLYLPRLTKKQIMAWAHKYHRRCVMGIKVTQQMVDVWLETLDEAQDLLKGKKLSPSGA